MHRLGNFIVEANWLMLLITNLVEVLLAGSTGTFVEGRVERVLHGLVYNALVGIDGGTVFALAVDEEVFELLHLV